MGLVLALVAASVAGCKSPPPPVAEVKSGLIARDGKLKSFHLAIDSTETGQPDGHHEVWFLAPFKLRAKVTQPQALELLFDGKQLAVHDGATGQRAVKPVDGSPEAAASLQQQFAALVPDGFTAPLLPGKGVTSTRAGDDVELAFTANDDGRQVAMRWRYRLPQLDLVSKTMSYGERTTELKVDEQHCDEALKLCVPKVVSRWQNGERLGAVTVRVLELNLPLTNDDFLISEPADAGQ